MCKLQNKTKQNYIKTDEFLDTLKISARKDMKRQMSIKKIDIIIKDISSYALDLHT